MESFSRIRSVAISLFLLQFDSFKTTQTAFQQAVKFVDTSSAVRVSCNSESEPIVVFEYQSRPTYFSKDWKTISYLKYDSDRKRSNGSAEDITEEVRNGSVKLEEADTQEWWYSTDLEKLTDLHAEYASNKPKVSGLKIHQFRSDGEDRKKQKFSDLYRKRERKMDERASTDTISSVQVPENVDKYDEFTKSLVSANMKEFYITEMDGRNVQLKKLRHDETGITYQLQLKDRSDTRWLLKMPFDISGKSQIALLQGNQEDMNEGKLVRKNLRYMQSFIAVLAIPQFVEWIEDPDEVLTTIYDSRETKRAFDSSETKRVQDDVLSQPEEEVVLRPLEPETERSHQFVTEVRTFIEDLFSNQFDTMYDKTKMFFSTLQLKVVSGSEHDLTLRVQIQSRVDWGYTVKIPFDRSSKAKEIFLKHNDAVINNVNGSYKLKEFQVNGAINKEGTELASESVTVLIREN